MSRSWWLLLLATGPLVGVCFIAAVHTYAEVSGLNGTAGGVGEALSPLIGVWGPTFSACEIAAVFLLPFVAIRLVAGDRQSGALKLELQHGMNGALRISAKAIVIFAGWTIAMVPALTALWMWKQYGGALYWPEITTLIAGHMINGALTIALGSVTASITEHPSTAAILTLAATVGTWIVNFLGAIHGGRWETAARYTPASLIAEFQHGLVRASTLLVCLIVILAGFGLSAVWMNLGARMNKKLGQSLLLTMIAASALFAAASATQTWDFSENRGNSFSAADEQMLRQIRGPLSVEIHLAPEDPRRMELERLTLSKLRRIMPGLRVIYVAKTSIGLFEQTSEGYGEIRYGLNNRTVTNRVTTPEGVLESIYSLAGMEPPKATPTEVFRGQPLATDAPGAGMWFYGGWPLATLAGAFIVRRRLR